MTNRRADVIRGLAVIAAIVLRIYAGIPVDQAQLMGELSMLLIGWQTISPTGTGGSK
jgi:hypothetical protein